MISLLRGLRAKIIADALQQFHTLLLIQMQRLLLYHPFATEQHQIRIPQFAFPAIEPVEGLWVRRAVQCLPNHSMIMVAVLQLQELYQLRKRDSVIMTPYLTAIFEGINELNLRMNDLFLTRPRFLYGLFAHCGELLV